MSKIQSATDSLRELIIYTGIITALATIGFELTEKRGWWDSLWWVIVTGSTVGYGDQYPATVGGRIIGALLIISMVFLLVPLIVAHMSSYMIVNNDAFTHAEQEQIKSDLTAIKKALEIK